MITDELDIASALNGFGDKNAKDRIHTACPGAVVAYDAVNRTADIQPQIRQRSNGEIVTYPVLKDVKVQFPGGGKWGVSWEPVEGDTGALLFSERSIAEWQKQGGVVTPKSDRHHHISDAFFLPGIWPDGEEPYTHTGDGITIGNKSNSISLKMTDSGIDVKGDLDVTGTITATGTIKSTLGDVVAGTVSLKTHTHPVTTVVTNATPAGPGAVTGAGTSAVPIP